MKTRFDINTRSSHFPPYTVLNFVTVSLHLTMGTTTQPPNQDMSKGFPKSPFDRIPGIPLLSATNTLAGSLHLDNLTLLPTPSSRIELLIVAYSQIPTIGSVLLQVEGATTDQPWELFWCLYVVWSNGIAERRGVAQIMQSSLREAAEPRPSVKSVLLG